jgi:hypothetical protein
MSRNMRVSQRITFPQAQDTGNRIKLNSWSIR